MARSRVRSRRRARRRFVFAIYLCARSACRWGRASAAGTTRCGRRGDARSTARAAATSYARGFCSVHVFIRPRKMCQNYTWLWQYTYF
jgi:hypothetical protein